jgi:glycosyltransferase involved in cell wall biosynthesis
MAEVPAATARHVLVYEPRVEGHHLGYLKAISEDLLSAGYRLTLAVDTGAEAMAKIETEMTTVLAQATVLAANDGSNKLRRVAALAARTQADLVFLPNLDEIGSAMLRRSALGIMPPKILRGKLGGIWHRPRFLGSLGFSLNQRAKAAGFARLLRGGWFSHLLLLDPYLHADFKRRDPAAPAFFLPDFFPADFAADRAAARRALDLPEDRRVFLFYGGGYRRKGLSLAVEAMRAMDRDEPAFLLCAGRQPDDREVAQGLAVLVREGRARVIDRYIFNAEEKQLFAASDVVLLPYRRHFGISGVLVRAIGAGLPVIASDEQLLGRLVREHDLGLLFPSGDVRALRAAIAQLTRAPADDMARRQAAVRAAAPSWTRAAFRTALLAAFDRARPSI